MFNTVHQELDVLSCRIKNISHARNGIQKTYLLSYCTSKSEQAENSLVLPRQYYFFYFYADNLNPIRSGLFQTVNDPGGGGGALKAPPYDLENYCVTLHHIIHVNLTRCFRHDPIGIFQKFAILTTLQQFQNKK